MDAIVLLAPQLPAPPVGRLNDDALCVVTEAGVELRYARADRRPVRQTRRVESLCGDRRPCQRVVRANRGRIDQVGAWDWRGADDPVPWVLKHPGVGTRLVETCGVRPRLRKHPCEGLRLAVEPRPRVQNGACVNTPDVGVLVPEHTNQRAIWEVLQRESGSAVRVEERLLWDRLAVCALPGSHADGTILQSVPDDRAECPDQWVRHL